MTEEYEDIRYELEGRTAIVTIDRPHRYNAFRGKTVEELISAFRTAWADNGVQAIILTGAGEKAFCTGGDVKQRAETGDYGPTESGMFEIGNLHKLIRDVPKPVIAAVNGLAIGGGQVLHVLCDLTIAADTAKGLVARLAGVESPVFEDTEKTLGELKARLDKTVVYLQTFKPEQIDGTEEKTIVLKRPTGDVSYPGLQYLLEYVTPNVYFHCTATYSILRHCGVDVGKKDFIGAL